jgi:hypothetical protein
MNVNIQAYTLPKSVATPILVKREFQSVSVIHAEFVKKAVL